MIIILYNITAASCNAHGEGHDHHHHDHGDHDAHHHHGEDGSGDCELDDSLAELIKSFGLSVLGKDQESADDIQPTEDHDHINIKALVEELFHPSTTPKTTTTTTQRTTWTERLPIKSHDLGWDISPVDLVMNNHLVQPVFGQEDQERHPRNFGATTQKPVYLTETHYYFPGDFGESDAKDAFAPIEEDRASKSQDLNLNLDISQLIDKPTIPVVDTRLANFLLVNGGRRPKVLPSISKPKQHINDPSDKSNVFNSVDKQLQFKQPTAAPFLIKFVDAPRKNNLPGESFPSKTPASPLLKGQNPANQLNTLISNTFGSSHSNLSHSLPPLPPSSFPPSSSSSFTTNPASTPKSAIKKRPLLQTALKHMKNDVQVQARKQLPRKGAHKSTGDHKSNFFSQQSRKKHPRKSNRHPKQRPGHHSSGQKLSSVPRQQKSLQFSDKRGKENKGMVEFNGLDMMRMKEDKFECGDRDEGLHADLHSGCQRFYMCHKRIRSGRFTCPTGTLFSNSLGVCDWAAKVQCGDFQP